MTWTCRHYGARPLSYCYCGAMVSRAAFYAAGLERTLIRQLYGSGWQIVRDDAGSPRRMEWRP